MGMRFSRTEGTGLAFCKICEERIEKGMACIFVSGYRSSGYCHADFCKPKKR